MTTYTPRHRAPAPRAHRRTALLGTTLAGALLTPMVAANATGGIPPILLKIRYCESGGNYTAQNPHSTASGAYQFLDTTWRMIPGTQGYSRAKFAPASVQDAAAIWLYNNAGTSPWLASKPCWGSATTVPTGITNTEGDQGGTSAGGSGDATGWNPELTDGYQKFPYAKIKLTKAEKTLLTSYTDQQKKQTWWTPQAAAGRIVVRTVVTNGQASLTHKAASFTSADAALVNNGDTLTGRYVDTDWFKITSGKQAGQYLSTSVLTRLKDVDNGKLDPAKQLCQLPDNLRGVSGDTSKYLNCASAKQLVYLAAAFRSHFGYDLTVNEGYRSLDTQKAYFAKLGNGIAAKPGSSNHGLGLAVDLWGRQFAWGTPIDVWMTKYARAYGWERPAPFSKPSGKEYWHYNFVG